MARNATPITQSLSAISAYKKGTSNPPSPVPNNANKTANCVDCRKKIHQFKQRANGSYNAKPYLRCIDCFRANKRRAEEPPRSNTARRSASKSWACLARRIPPASATTPSASIGGGPCSRSYSPSRSSCLAASFSSFSTAAARQAAPEWTLTPVRGAVSTRGSFSAR